MLRSLVREMREPGVPWHPSPKLASCARSCSASTEELMGPAVSQEHRRGPGPACCRAEHTPVPCVSTLPLLLAGTQHPEDRHASDSLPPPPFRRDSGRCAAADLFTSTRPVMAGTQNVPVPKNASVRRGHPLTGC